MFLQKAAFFGQNSTLTQSSRVRAVLKAFLVPFLVFVRSKITINKNIKLPPPLPPRVNKRNIIQI